MKNLIYVIILLLFAKIAYSQSVVATVDIDTNNVLIGEPINLILKFDYTDKLKVTFPQIPDSLGKLEVLSRSKIDTISQNNIKSLKQTITVTSFDSGHYEVPAFTFLYEKEGFDSPYPINSNQLFLHFATVSVDTAKPIKDIKGPLEIPLTLVEILIYVFYGLILTLIIYVGYLIYKKIKGRNKPQKVILPVIPPHLFALDELRKLDSEKLWQNGDYKQYHIRLTDIIREYLSKRYVINSLEMTTDEILDVLKNIRAVNYEQLKQILKLGDLAKFAKFEPLSHENELSMKNAYDFVASTFEIEGQSMYSNQTKDDKLTDGENV